jgi:hypothetical protein
MSDIDKNTCAALGLILDTELQQEIVALEAEILQANIDCQNALAELGEVTKKEIKQSVHEFMEEADGR